MRGWALAALLIVLGACQGQADLTLPTAGQVQEYYASVPGLQDAEMHGNVAVVTVRQPASQLRRGGTLWAKVGPFIYLFSEETQRLFQDFGGLGGVRVITRTETGTEVANAMLAREELSDVLWRRSLNIAGLARRDGTERVTLIEDLVDWGEDHTEFEYNGRFTQRR